MKQVIGLIVSILLYMGTTVAQSTDTLPPATIPLPSGKNTWKMIFHDEFEGSTYDKTKWTPHADWGGNKSFNSGREHYYESQIQVHDGICHLVAEPHPTITDFDGSYMSGEILTCRDTPSGNPPYKFTFKYGYVEARVKNVNIPGFFNDFWMLPAKTNYVYEWEIDILEVLGHDYYTMHQTYHYRQGLPYNLARNESWNTLDNPGRNGTGPDMNFSRDYHTFAVDWQPDHLTFYIDGIASGTFDDPGTNYENIPNSPGYIILQQMVDNTWIRSTGIPLPNTTISETYYIDYVRVWQAEYDPTVSIEEEQARRKECRMLNAERLMSNIPNPASLQTIKTLGNGVRVFKPSGELLRPGQVTGGGVYYIGSRINHRLRRIIVIK